MLDSFLNRNRIMHKEIISIIGAGGKTTLIHRLADEYRKQNSKVLICTTTHMFREPETDISCNAEQIIAKMEQQGSCMAGKLDGENSDKITTLSEDVLRRAIDHADVTLIEADGSKHLPVKYPGAHEPVIYPYSTKIILVMGLWTLGEPIKKTVFRYEELIKRFGWREEDGLTFEMLNVIIRDGYMKKLLTEENSIEMQILFTEKVNGELHYIGYEEAGEKYGLQ